MDLESHLVRDEGLRLKVYDDATGKELKPGMTLKGWPSVGIGRNLAGPGITREEAFYLLHNDIVRVREELTETFPFYVDLSPVRKCVLENLCFNLGLTKLLKFRETTLPLIEQGRYKEAAQALRSSLWYQQVGTRAKRLAYMLEHDQEPDW